MLKDLFHLIFCIVIYQYQIWQETLSMVLLHQLLGMLNLEGQPFTIATLNIGCTFITSGSSNLAALHLII